MMSKLRSKSDKFYLGVSVAVLLVISVAATLLIGLGVGFFDRSTQQANAAIDTPKIIDVKSVPMALAIDQTIEQNDSGWGKRDEKKLFSLPPFPFSCASNVVNPSYSATQGFNANTGLTVTINGYSAGLGALAFQENVDKPGRCVGGNTAVYTSPVEELGAEAVLITAQRGGITNQSVTWRRGDVVAFLSADEGNPIESAKVLDRNLTAKIDGKCKNESSSVHDAKRTVWSDNFEGYKISEAVTIAKADLPVVPEAQKDQYEVTSLPSGKMEVLPVSAPEKPSHPVWPLMPAEVELPKLPQSPSKEAPSSKQVIFTREDVDGPGCGWEFTGTVKPVFNKAEADAQNSEARSSAIRTLEKESEDWTKAVLEYWKANKVFTEKADQYNEYVAKVQEVSVAWAQIQKKWDTYYANLEIHEETAEANRVFLADQKRAQEEYDAQIGRCEVQDKEDRERKDREAREALEPSPSPSPSTSTSPSPTATPSPSPSVSETPRIECPPVRPDILSQEAPAVFERPQEPANPIPESER